MSRYNVRIDHHLCHYVGCLLPGIRLSRRRENGTRKQPETGMIGVLSAAGNGSTFGCLAVDGDWRGSRPTGSSHFPSHSSPFARVRATLAPGREQRQRVSRLLPYVASRTLKARDLRGSGGSNPSASAAVTGRNAVLLGVSRLRRTARGLSWHPQQSPARVVLHQQGRGASEDDPHDLTTARQQPCRCRKVHPCWSGCVMVFVEDAAESITSLDVEVVEWGCCIGGGRDIGQAVPMRRRPRRVPPPQSGFAGFRFPPDVIMVAVPVVPALQPVLSRRRGAAGRAWHHG
jgi:hypothetical protein